MNNFLHKISSLFLKLWQQSNSFVGLFAYLLKNVLREQSDHFIGHFADAFQWPCFKGLVNVAWWAIVNSENGNGKWKWKTETVKT